jgi:hypothetical protein
MPADEATKSQSNNYVKVLLPLAGQTLLVGGYGSGLRALGQREGADAGKAQTKAAPKVPLPSPAAPLAPQEIEAFRAVLKKETPNWSYCGGTFMEGSALTWTVSGGGTAAVLEWLSLTFGIQRSDTKSASCSVPAKANRQIKLKAYAHEVTFIGARVVQRRYRVVSTFGVVTYTPWETVETTETLIGEIEPEGIICERCCI